MNGQVKIRAFPFDRLITNNRCDCGSVQFMGCLYKVWTGIDTGMRYKHFTVEHDLDCNHSPFTEHSTGYEVVGRAFRKYQVSGRLAILTSEQWHEMLNTPLSEG